MKHIINFSKPALLAIMLTLVFSGADCKKDETPGPWYPITNENGEPVFGVFESRIPCPDCERMKFGLVIYKDAQTNMATSYFMSRIFVGKGNERTTNKGQLTTEAGTQLDSLAIVYQLDSNAPEEFKLFWKISEDILFILDKNLMPRVGDAGYGYVLNRVE